MICLYVSVQATMCMWGSEENLQESALFFHLVGPGEQTKVICLGRKHLHLPSHTPGRI